MFMSVNFIVVGISTLSILGHGKPTHTIGEGGGLISRQQPLPYTKRGVYKMSLGQVLGLSDSSRKIWMGKERGLS